MLPMLYNAVTSFAGSAAARGPGAGATGAAHRRWPRLPHNTNLAEDHLLGTLVACASHHCTTHWNTKRCLARAGDVRSQEYSVPSSLVVSLELSR